MPAIPPASTPARGANTLRRPLLITGFALLLGAVVALAITASANGQTKSEQLSNVRAQQDDIAAELASSEGAVAELMGQVSELRDAEAAANAELAAQEAELAEASEELADGRAELERLRKEYAAAREELEGMLVSMYKSPTPDLGSVLLNSSDIEDYAQKSEYYDRVQAYQSAVISRAETLKEEMITTVAGLEDSKQRAEDARDEVQARRDEIAGQRAELEAREAELQQVRAERQAMLDQLGDREGNLERAIERQAAAAAEAAATPDSSGTPAPAPAAPVPGETAVLNSDGTASPPAGAPSQVVAAIQAANAISDTPYVWGGGHGSFEDSGYDCSGAVSYALHGGGFLDSPLDSSGLMSWGDDGAGKWITVYANPGHTYVVIAGLRFDTSGTGGSGPRWSTSLDGYLDPSAYAIRHPAGF